MRISRTTLVAAICGTAASVVVAAGPRDPKPSVSPERKNRQVRQLQAIGPAAEQPRILNYIKVRRMADGRVVPTSPLMPYTGQAGAPDAPSQNAFDIFESDASGVPTGGISCGFVGEAYRWFFGTAWISASIVNDFGLDAAALGKPLDRVDIAWNWGAGAVRPMWILLEIYDTFNACTGAPPPAATFVDGVAYQFVDQAGGGGYFYTNIGFDPLNPNEPPAGVTAPADGNGAYALAFGVYDSVAQTFTLDVTPGTQQMLWGQRVPTQLGTHGPNEWDDDGGTPGPQTSNGVWDPTECYNYGGAVPCPANPVGAMLAFWVDPAGGGGGCYANCDDSTGNPALTANDFQCFINKYAANDPYANCDGSTGTPALTANDFQCFINKYAAGCT